eukprot:760211-Hanusia_phi.AAC.1
MSLSLSLTQALTVPGQWPRRMIGVGGLSFFSCPPRSVGLSSEPAMAGMRSVEEAKVEEMRERGFCVIDDFLEPEKATRMRDEIKKLKDLGKLTPNKVQFSLNGRIAHFTKPNVSKTLMNPV